jgi:hypothetical protein
LTCSLPPTSLPGTPLRRGLILAHGVSRLVPEEPVSAPFQPGDKLAPFADYFDCEQFGDSELTFLEMLGEAASFQF